MYFTYNCIFYLLWRKHIQKNYDMNIFALFLFNLKIFVSYFYLFILT